MISDVMVQPSFHHPLRGGNLPCLIYFKADNFHMLTFL